MNPTAVSLNAFVCGAVAAASLCASSREAASMQQAGVADAEPKIAPAPAPAPRGWRRGLAGLVDLVSGPAPVRA